MITITLNWTDKLSDKNRFQLVLDDEAVLDKETGLIWERSPSDTVKKWNEATIFCYKKNIGNRKGWRLPSIEELLSLVDSTQSDPALPSGHFFNNVHGGYWSATTVVNAPGQAWVLSIGSGNLDTDNKNIETFVWAVRGGRGLLYSQK